MIDYIFRNHKTGMELKRTLEKEPNLFKWLKIMIFVPRGYKLQQVVDYRVSARERKAK